jgi:hypothetical protein
MEIEIGLFVKGHSRLPQQPNRTSFANSMQVAFDQVSVDRCGGFSFEAQQDGAIATVSSPGGSQRPVQVDLDAFDLQQQPVSGQSLGKLAKQPSWGRRCES